MKKFGSDFSHKPYLLSLLSALFLSLSFPKFDLSILVFFSLIPLFSAVREYENNILKLSKLGFTFGVTYFTILLYWIVYTLHKYGNIPWYFGIFLLLMLSLYLSIYFVIFLLLSAKIRAFSEPGFAKGLSVGVIFVSTEYLRSTLLTGFPWGLLGYPLSSYTILLQFAELFGIWGLSFLVVFINYYLYYILYLFQRPSFTGKSFLIDQLCFIVSFLIILGYSFYSLKFWENQSEKFTSSKEALRVALLQGNIPQELKEAKEIEISQRVYERLLFISLENRPQFIFYPETAFPFYFPHDRDHSLRLLSVLERVRREADWEPVIVFGTFRVSAFSPKHRVHNTLIVWQKGEIVDLYDKEKLVPFGEYIPLGDYFPFLRRISVVSDIIKPGISKNLKVSLAERELSFVPLICFESAFPQILVKRLRKGGDFVFIATNDAWFGRTSAPYQHFQMAIVRAVEGRRFVLQSANTGITGVIDPLGRVLVKSELEREEVVSGTIIPLKERTFFVRWGYLFPVFSSVFTAIFSLFLLLQILRKTKLPQT